MKTLFLFSAFCFIFLSTQAQIFYTGFDNASEKAGWTEYKKGVNSAPYEWSYGTMNPYSAPEYLTHNYPVGGTQQTDDWFVSPQIGFYQGGYIDSLYYSFSGFGTPMAGDTIALYLLEGSPDPDLATSQTVIYNFTDSTYLNDNTWRTTGGIMLPAISGDYHFAFRYSTVANWLDARFDNFQVTIYTGVEENQNDLVKFYPNPSSSLLYFSSEDLKVEQVEIFDLSGRSVLSARPVNSSMDVSSLSPGGYMVRMSARDRIFTKKLLIRK